MKQNIEQRIAYKYGRKYIELRYKGYPWSGWFFATSEEPKKNYIYVPEFNVYRCNISAF